MNRLEGAKSLLSIGGQSHVGPTRAQENMKLENGTATQTDLTIPGPAWLGTENAKTAGRVLQVIEYPCKLSFTAMTMFVNFILVCQNFWQG